jgi:methylase of polypeptide subunit release factors
LFEITLARHNPSAEVWAVDWPNVLEVARENATAAGVSGRYHTIPGSASMLIMTKDY